MVNFVSLSLLLDKNKSDGRYSVILCCPLVSFYLLIISKARPRFPETIKKVNRTQKDFLAPLFGRSLATASFCHGRDLGPKARSIQPKFPEISVQNSMDRFGPTGKGSKKLVHLLRWSSFPGQTGWNFG